MLSLLLLFLVTQVPCAPMDSTVVCHCKQGQASACTALRETDAKAADAIEEGLRLAKVVEEAAREHEATEADEADAQVADAAPEPPDCKGQNHHIISRPIADALKDHKTLGGLFKPRDPRFVARAKDQEAHCGYQQWHREVDKEVIAWLKVHQKATLEEFMALLREIYSRPAMRARFPNGF